MKVIRWTPRPRADLAAIRAFIDEDSPHYAAVVLSRLIAATERLAVFPESGRSVPEFQSPVVGEVIFGTYRGDSRSARRARWSALDDVVNVEDVRRIRELDAGGGEDRH